MTPPAPKVTITQIKLLRDSAQVTMSDGASFTLGAIGIAPEALRDAFACSSSG